MATKKQLNYQQSLSVLQDLEDTEECIYIPCNCGRKHKVTVPNVLLDLKVEHQHIVLEFVNQIAWLNQRIEELSNDLFIAQECD